MVTVLSSKNTFKLPDRKYSIKMVHFKVIGVSILLFCYVAAAPRPLDFETMGRKIKEFSQKVVPVVRGTCGIVNDLAMLNDQLQAQNIQQYQNNEQILPQQSYQQNQKGIPNTPAAFRNTMRK